jgi:hypothetical protein
MQKKLKAISVFALSGFLIGIAANILYFDVAPSLVPVVMHYLPQILGTTWILWGIAGAAVSIAGCLVYVAWPDR